MSTKSMSDATGCLRCEALNVPGTHTRTHVRTNTHAQTHTHKHTHTHTRTHTHTLTHTQTHMHIYRGNADAHYHGGVGAGAAIYLVQEKKS